MKIKIIVYKVIDRWEASGIMEGQENHGKRCMGDEWYDAVGGCLRRLIGSGPEEELTVEIKHRAN